VQTPAELVAFIERERPRLVRAAHLLVGSHAVAEEIAQEALLRAASRWEKVNRMESPGGWVHRVTVNLATSQLRRRRVERRAKARLDVDEGSDATAGTAEAIAVRRALASLSVPLRRSLVLHHVLGWTAAEIGEVEGASAEAIRQRLHRGRDALREELGPTFVGSDTGGSVDTTDHVRRGNDLPRLIQHDEETSDVR
jgi:RNA polymerase sigma-70 factor, ECF subfamily